MGIRQADQTGAARTDEGACFEWACRRVGGGERTRVQPRQPYSRLWMGTAVLALSLAGREYTLAIEDISSLANGPVLSLAVQTDGKILLGGRFTQLAGQPCENLGRLNADGSLDTGFRAAGAWVVAGLAVQADAKILVGGLFTNLVCTNIARLNADGSPDLDFAAWANDAVRPFALQPDGKIVVGGPFITSLNGQARKYIGRLNTDGTLDTTFNADVTQATFSLIVQPDGKVLVGGDFGIRRFNVDGSSDATFNPKARGLLWSMALQGDGKVLVSFSRVSAFTNTATGRLNADGSLDTNFHSAVRTTANSIGLQADGKILTFGSGLHRLNPDGSLDASFSSGTSLKGILMGLHPGGILVVSEGALRFIRADTPASSLSYLDTVLTWLPGGTTPDVGWMTFEYSTDGTDWNAVGQGTHIPGGWQLGGVTLPAGYTVRARGPVTGGYGNNCVWFVESATGKPAITLQPASRIGYVGNWASLEVRAIGSEPLSYQWIKDGAELASATNRTLAFSRVRQTDARDYSVIVSNLHGSRTSSVAVLTVRLPPAILVDDGSFGLTNGQFGFNIQGRPGQTVVIEKSRRLGTWVPMKTNVLGDGPFYVSEPVSSYHLPVFHRLRLLE